jgi:hypothetical protein
MLMCILLWCGCCVFLAYNDFFLMNILHFCYFNSLYGCVWYASVLWLYFVWSPYEVHDFENNVCNNMYEHAFCMHAIMDMYVCMDNVRTCMDVWLTFLSLKRNMHYNKLQWRGNISNDMVQTNKSFERIK